MKHVAFIVALALFGSGCEAVYSDRPMGTDAGADPAVWEGVWRAKDAKVGDLIRIQVTDASTGELEITSENDASADDGERHEEEARAFVRRHGDSTFVNIACVDDGCGEPTAGYLWAVARFGNDTLSFWAPDAKLFGALVDLGVLPGKRDDSDVRIHALEENDYGLIEAVLDHDVSVRDPDLELTRSADPATEPPR